MQLKVCSCARVISLLPKWTEGQKRAEKSEEAFYKPARATSNEMYKISLSSRVSPLQSWNQKKSLQGIAIFKLWPLQALNNAFDSLIVLSFKGHETKNNQWCPEFENEKTFAPILVIITVRTLSILLPIPFCQYEGSHYLKLLRSVCCLRQKILKAFTCLKTKAFFVSNHRMLLPSSHGLLAKAKRLRRLCLGFLKFTI